MKIKTNSQSVYIKLQIKCLARSIAISVTFDSLYFVTFSFSIFIAYWATKTVS